MFYALFYWKYLKKCHESNFLYIESLIEHESLNMFRKNLLHWVTKLVSISVFPKDTQLYNFQTMLERKHWKFFWTSVWWAKYHEENRLLLFQQLYIYTSLLAFYFYPFLEISKKIYFATFFLEFHLFILFVIPPKNRFLLFLKNFICLFTSYSKLLKTAHSEFLLKKWKEKKKMKYNFPQIHFMCTSLLFCWI